MADDTLFKGSPLRGTPYDDVLFSDQGEIGYWRWIQGFDGNDRIFGGKHNDVLFGDTGHDRIHGRDGRDSLIGGEGNDMLFGEAGNDQLSGGAGFDILEGGQGRDILVGGAGNDFFVFNNGDGLDFINDFQDDGSGQDVIDMRGANTSFDKISTRQEGRDTVITYNVEQNGTIVLANYDMSSLGVDDFYF